MGDKRLNGQISSIDPSHKSDYIGHTVRLEFEREVETGSDATLFYRASLSTPVESTGAYSLLIDERVLEDQTAVLEVRSPLGTRLFEASLRELIEEDRLRAIKLDPELPFEIPTHPDPFKGQRRVFTGRVLDLDSKRDAANRMVLIFVTADEEAGENPENEPVLVFAGRTNQKGYISGEYPKGVFAAAVAEVDGVRAPIRLEEGRFPLRVVLALSLPPERSESSGSSSPPRAPDEEDLLNSPESFSSDLGVGGCVDFTVPNRTLEEVPFYKIVRTTDPDIKGTNLEPPIKLQPDFDILLKQLAFGQDTIDSKLKVRPAQESALDLTSLVEPLVAANGTAQPRAEQPTNVARSRTTAAVAAEPPSLVPLEASGVATAAQWRSAVETKSIDVALKEALPSLSAESLRSVLVDPDEFTPVSLMTAERLSTHQLLSDLVRVIRKPVSGRAALNEQNPVDWDDTPTFYQATSIAHGHILQFRQVWKADGYSLGDLLHSIPLAPCQKKQIVTIDWDRREDAARTEDLSEREFLFANLVRDRDVKEMMDTALSEEIDGGSTAKTYGGGGGLGFAIGPLVIGAAGGGGGADSEAWQNSSREISGLTMNELKDRINQSAAAVRSQRATVVQTLGQGERSRVETEVIANHNHCHALTIQYFEVLRHFQVLEELAEVRECLFVPFLMTRFHDAKVLRWREALSRNLLKRSLQPAFDAIERIQLNYLGSDLPPGMFAEEPLEALDGELRVRITIARPRDPKTDEVDYFKNVWPFWTRLIGGNPSDVYDRYLRNQQFKDRVFREQLAPQIAEKFISSLRVVLYTDDGAEVETNLDPTLASKYRVGETHTVTLSDSGNTPGVARKNIVAVEIRSDYELPEHSQVVVESASFLYHTRHLRHFLYQNSRVLDDLLFGDPVYFSTSRLTKEEERNPRAEDQELRRRMLTHLNANLEYYHKAMWWTLDKERRFILLDGFLAPHSGGRSVASVVHNDLIGIVGNSLVFPVVAGFQLDPRYRALRDQEDPRKPPPDLFDLYAPITPNPPRVLSVPTKGVFAEAVMGACNSCEKIDESRFWRWSESPCPDDPPPIAPVTVGSRAGATPDLTATDFPAPIVNFQNIPEAPDPSGLRAALELIGRGDMFRDITGLTQNQKNALGALQASLSTAEAFGQEAIQLAHAQAAQRSIDQTLKNAAEAKQDGRLTDEAARAVTKGALQALIGQQGQQGASIADAASMNEAMSAALNADKGSVKFTEEKAGESQTLEVSKEGGPGEEGQAATFEVAHDDFVGANDFIDLPAIKDDLDKDGNWKVLSSTSSLNTLFDNYMASLASLRDSNKRIIAKLHWQEVGLTGGFIRLNPTDASRLQTRADLHIFYPAATADAPTLAPSATPYPVVVIVHGNHPGWEADLGNLRPTNPTRTVTISKDDGTSDIVPTRTADATGQTLSHHGYEGLQRELARRGIVSVSVNTNFANSLDARVRMRAETALRCLDYLRTKAETDRGSRYFGKLDFSKVGLMGHSRGGDAVIDMFGLNEARVAAASPVEKPYGIRAICQLAPSDLTGEAKTGKLQLSSNDVFLFVLHGSQDAEVYAGDPFKHYDRADCPKCLVFARGCTHRRFNSNWLPDDPMLPPPRIPPLLDKRKTADEHINLAKEYIGGLFRWKLKGENALQVLFDGTRANSAGRGSTAIPVAVQWQFGERVIVIDDFERVGPLNNRSAARDILNGTIVDMIGASGIPALQLPHTTKGLRFVLTAGGTFRLTDQLSFLDFFSDFEALTFRMHRGYTDLSSDAVISPPTLKFPKIKIILRQAGREGTVTDIYAFNPRARSTPDHQPIRFPKESSDANVTKVVFETYRVPLTAFTGLNSGPIDVNAIPEVIFELDPANQMDVFIDSVCLVKR